MIGILFFLFEFYDDQFLAFMVLILVWLCQLFTLIRFSYLALSTAEAFMQHLILYFWNRFEVPALQRFMQSRRSQLQQQPDFRITSSTFLASTLHITRLNNRNASPNADMAAQTNSAQDNFGLQAQTENDNPDQIGNRLQIPGLPNLRTAEAGANPGLMNSFSSPLLWILGGASWEGLNSILSMFRDVRDQGQAYAESPRHSDGGNAPDVQ